jgi:hypothetical protein
VDNIIFRRILYLLEVDLLRIVEESRLLRRTLRELNSTFIALILKIQDPCKFEDYRPISLCNLIYKLIAKVIANMIKSTSQVLFQRNNLASCSIGKFMMLLE